MLVINQARPPSQFFFFDCLFAFIQGLFANVKQIQTNFLKSLKIFAEKDKKGTTFNENIFFSRV